MLIIPIYGDLADNIRSGLEQVRKDMGTGIGPENKILDPLRTLLYDVEVQVGEIMK